MKYIFATCIILALFLSACGPNYIYHKKNSFSNDSWTYENVQQHRVEITDTQHLYNLIIGVKHSAEYASQNLYVKIKTIYPNQKSQEQILSLDFADGSGKWYGKCSGKTCSIEIPIQQNAIFEKPGTYQFFIEQYMRTEKVEGVKELSFKVEKTKEIIKTTPEK